MKTKIIEEGTSMLVTIRVCLALAFVGLGAREARAQCDGTSIDAWDESVTLLVRNHCDKTCTVAQSSWSTSASHFIKGVEEVLIADVAEGSVTYRPTVYIAGVKDAVGEDGAPTGDLYVSLFARLFPIQDLLDGRQLYIELSYKHIHDQIVQKTSMDYYYANGMVQEGPLMGCGTQEEVSEVKNIDWELAGAIIAGGGFLVLVSLTVVYASRKNSIPSSPPVLFNPYAPVVGDTAISHVLPQQTPLDPRAVAPADMAVEFDDEGATQHTHL